MKKTKPATAGERISRDFGSVLATGSRRAVSDFPLSRRIDAAIRRAVRKERERCAKIAICTTDPWVNKYKAIKEGAVL
mgnify:CR=1 FL=1